MDDSKVKIMQKLTQYIASIFGGLLLAFETSLDYFIPCLLAVILDVISAYFLGRRVHRKYTDKSDWKFKSEYKRRVIYTMLIVWICVILANYVDIAVRHSDDGLAVRFAVGVFLFYEIWSCLENWSSEKDKLWGGIWDWIDFGLTVGGVATGYTIRGLIFGFNV